MVKAESNLARKTKGLMGGEGKMCSTWSMFLYEHGVKSEGMDWHPFVPYILCLHSKYFPLSSLPPPHMSHKPSSLHPFLKNHPPPISLSWYFPTMLHQAFPGSGSSPSSWESFDMLIMSWVFRVSGLINIHLSVTTFHLYSFVIELPHLGWYFPVPNVCLKISWVHCF